MRAVVGRQRDFRMMRKNKNGLFTDTGKSVISRAHRGKSIYLKLELVIGTDAFILSRIIGYF